MTHTPGPWEDSPNAPDAIISTDKGAVREWVGDGTGYMEAGLTYYGGAVICESVRQHDKPLLKAAPEMLDALEAFVEWATSPKTEYTDFRVVLEGARTAIAKGRPPKKVTDE